MCDCVIIMIVSLRCIIHDQSIIIVVVEGVVVFITEVVVLALVVVAVMAVVVVVELVVVVVEGVVLVDIVKQEAELKQVSELESAWA